MNEETSSGGTGATLTPPPPATGTSTATPGVTPAPQSSASLDEALRKSADLERTLANATEELERHRKNAKKLADYEQRDKAAQEAALSELDKATKRASDAEARIASYQKQLVSMTVKLAAQSRGIIDPDIAALAIQDSLELGDDGLPTNLDKALDSLVKHKPYLVAPKPAEPGATTVPATPAQTAAMPGVQTPAIPAMNPGRSSIMSPGAAPKGVPMRLDQVDWSRKQ